MKNISVKQEEKDQVPLEVLATSIRAIAAGIKNLRKGPLGEKALILLIQDNCHMTKGYRRKKVNINSATIKSVLESIESLQSKYLK